MVRKFSILEPVNKISKINSYLITILLIILIIWIAQYALFSRASPPSNRIITINLTYSSGSFDTDDNGIENLSEIIDYDVLNSEFSWDVNKSNLGARWEIHSIDTNITTTLCHGSALACGIIGVLPVRENWNETLYLSYGKYGFDLNNTVSAQLIYSDYSFDKDNPYSEIYYSEWQSLSGIFLNETLHIDINDTINSTNITQNNSLLNLSENITNPTQNISLTLNISNHTLRNIPIILITDKFILWNSSYIGDSNLSDNPMYFDGINHYFIIPNSNNITFPDNSIWIETTIKIDLDTHGVIVSKYDYLNSKFFELAVNGEGTIKFELGDLDTSIAIETIKSFNDGDYHSIFASVYAGNAEIYVDGVLESIADISVIRDINSNVTISIGANLGYLEWIKQPVNNFRGSIRYVKIYN